MPNLKVHPQYLKEGDILEYGGTIQRVAKVTPKDANRTVIETTLPHSEWTYDEFVVKNSVLLNFQPPV